MHMRLPELSALQARIFGARRKAWLQSAKQMPLRPGGGKAEGFEDTPVEGSVMADDRFAQPGFEHWRQVQRALWKTIRATAKIAHTVDKISVSIRGLIGDVVKAFDRQIAVKHPAAVVHRLLGIKPALVVEIAGIDHVKACLFEKACRALPPVGPMVGGVEGNFFDIQRAQSFDQSVAGHVKTHAVLVA